MFNVERTNLTYSLVAGSDGAYVFSIHPAFGYLFVKAIGLLDFETMPVVQVNVQVRVPLVLRIVPLLSELVPCHGVHTRTWLLGQIMDVANSLSAGGTVFVTVTDGNEGPSRSNARACVRACVRDVLVSCGGHSCVQRRTLGTGRWTRRQRSQCRSRRTPSTARRWSDRTCPA